MARSGTERHATPIEEAGRRHEPAKLSPRGGGASNSAEPLLPVRRPASLEQAVVALAAVLAVCYFAGPVFITLLVAVLLAFVLEPIVRGLERIRLPRSIAALAAVVFALSLVYGITYVSYYRAADFLQELPKYSRAIQQEVMRFRHHAQQLQRATETVLPQSADDKGVVRVRPLTNLSERIAQSAGALSGFLFLLVFVPFLAYFMLTWQEHARAATVMLFREEYRQTAYVTLGRIASMIRGFLIGNLIIGLLLSAISVLVFGLLHLPFFYFIGVISGLLSLLPTLGVVLAVVPPLAASFGHAGGARLLLIAASVVGIHALGFSVFYPKLLGRRLQLNPLGVTISMLVWGWMWGGIGLVLAVPITGALKITFDHVDRLRPFGVWLGE